MAGTKCACGYIFALTGYPSPPLITSTHSFIRAAPDITAIPVKTSAQQTISDNETSLLEAITKLNFQWKSHTL